MFADLGNFNGEISHFEEWWLKMKTWLNINQLTIPSKSYNTRPEKGLTYTWTELEVDIVKQYRLTARPDWARQKLWKLKQENIQSCDYVNLFTKYFKDAGIGHSHALDILEQNMNAEI